MKVVIGLVSLFCLILIGLGFYLAGRDEHGGPRIVPLNNLYTHRMTSGAWQRGTPDAKVKVITYTDYACLPCRSLHIVTAQAYDANKNDMLFEVHHLPINKNPNAKLAAKAAEAAGRQGKFWDMDDLLFSRQPAWLEMTEEEFRAALPEYAGTLQLNVRQFNKDLRDTSLQDPIDKDILSGQSRSIEELPVLIVNEEYYDQQLPSTPAQFTEIIQKALQEVVASPSPTP